MIIAESIRVEVYKYNYAAHGYDLVTTLTESSIISAASGSAVQTAHLRSAACMLPRFPCRQRFRE